MKYASVALLLLVASVARAADEAPTFSRDVAPILWKNCAGCHHPGHVAPFSLLTYRDAAKRAKFLADTATSGRMPPWRATPGYGPEFINERRMSEADIRTLTRWAEAGAPEGDPKELPAVPKLPEGWQLGKPDLVVTPAHAFTVRPSDADVYRNLVIRTPLTSGVFVRAAEFKTGGAPIHHAVIRVDRTAASRHRDGQDGQPGFEGMAWDTVQDPGGHFIGWAPGRGPIVAPEGMPWPLEPGSDLVVELHVIPQKKPSVI